MEDFEYIEHTADVGIRVFGKDLEKLFENAARATFSLITEHEPGEDKEREANLEGQTLEDLLLNWLNELISVFFTYKFLPASYNINIEAGNPNKLEAKLKGTEYDPYSKEIKLEIKAATYHNLRIEKTQQGYKTEIIFDV